LVFGAFHLIPQQRNAQVLEQAITWNYTTWLNIVFLLLAALLVWRFYRTGGPEMLRMMENDHFPQKQQHDHSHDRRHSQSSANSLLH
jgi:hypothetical protein